MSDEVLLEIDEGVGVVTLNAPQRRNALTPAMAGELMAAGVLDPAVFVSHRFPLDSYVEALSQFRAGVGRKILIEP